MGKIKKILENELIGGTQSTEVYPVTSTKAVYDTDNKVLDDYIQHLKKTSTFAGIATPTTNPGTPDGPVFYIAAEPGIYPNFSGITIGTDEAALLVWNGGATWEKEVSGFVSNSYLMEKLAAEAARAKAAEEANAQAIVENKARLDDGVDLYPSLTLVSKYNYLKLENGNAVVKSGGNKDWGYTDFIDVTSIDKIYYNLASFKQDTVLIAAYDSDNNFVVNNSVVVGDVDDRTIYNEGVWQKASGTSKIKISTKVNYPEGYINTGQLFSIEKMRETINDGFNNVKHTFVDVDNKIGEINNNIEEINNNIGDFSYAYEALSGSIFNSINSIASNVGFKTINNNPAYVCSFGKNIQSLDKIKFYSKLKDTEIIDGGFICTIPAGATFTAISVTGIFVKAGTYNIHREFSVLSGESVSNTGMAYIRGATSKEYSNLTLITTLGSSTTDTVINLADDTWVQIDYYTTVNTASTADFTVKFYNLQLEAGDSYTGYESYRGESLETNEGKLRAFPNMNIFADSDIIINVQKETIASELAKIKDIEIEEEINDIVCFGDSLTNGTGSSTGKPTTETNTDLSYPAVLKRLINDGRDVINAGVGGEPSWMVAYRQGAETLMVEPFTMPSDGKVRVYVKGQEDDYFYNNEWTFSEGNLSHNISVSEHSQVNPCKIAGIEGILSRELISEGESDPTTGETVQQNTYVWYFTRNTAGDSVDITRPMQVVTNAYDKLRGYIQVIWCGQNDAPSHDGAYITQPYDYKRTKLMVDNLTTNRYIVMNYPSGSDESKAKLDQEWNQLFGVHYINIRKYISKYGVEIANSLGAGIEISDSDKTLIEKGTIPTCLRVDGVHGNYWYYQIVARAVYDKGKSLGYW